MFIIIIVLFIIVTILSIIVFNIKGFLSLLITVPLIIMYINSNKIIKLLKKERRCKDKIYLSERKEVDFVSSRDRKNVVKKDVFNFKIKSKEKEKQKITKEKNKDIRNKDEDKKDKFTQKTEEKNDKLSKKTENKKIKEDKKESSRRISEEKRKNKIVIFKKKEKNTNRREEKKKPKKKRKLLKTLLSIFLSFCILGVFAVAAFFIYIVVTTEEFDPEALKNQDQSVIYDKDGNEIATLGNEKRETIEYDALPQVLIDAIIATEDSRFYEHNGVDMARFLKAAVLQVLGQDDAGGASTLTMQVVKNNLTDTTRSGLAGIIRKFKDVYLSVFFMEQDYSKNEILTMYVNDSGLGGMIYGVEEASNYYFGKTVSELSLPEAALLAGMYQAPSSYNPYRHPEAAAERRNTVLTLMVRHGYITEEEKEMANAVSIESMLVGNEKESDYQGYIDTVIKEVIEKTGNDPAQVSMKIYTALDKNIQDGINSVLNGESYKGWADDKVQAGIAITNVNTGEIVAIGAGRNREAGDWNYATQAKRQPGSTAKPLFDYGPGFEYNDYSTYTLFNDEKWTYTNGPEVGNWDGGYQGLITLRQALSVSRNIPALKAFQQTDKKNITSFVNGLGLDVAYSTSSDNYKKLENGADNLLNEAYSIGGVGIGFSPLDMAEAYACFANGGYHIETHAVTKIEYRSTGEVIDFSQEREKVMSDSTAYLMNNVLQYAVEYAFNGGARVYGSTVAAKTGTSNLSDDFIKQNGLPAGAVNDLWTVAYTPEYSVALWYGYEKADKDHYLSGASAPKDDVMRAVMKYVPKSTTKWQMPSSVVAVTVEKESWPAKLASEYTPADMRVTEYFKKGTQPTEVSDRYAKLNSVTNLQSTKDKKGYQITWNWKTPDVLDATYLSKYFSNSVYGNESAEYLKKRLDYNSNTLGANGFSIYEKTSTGELKLLDFVEDNEYLYVPTTDEDITLVVKAEHKNFKDNASDGKEIEIKYDGTVFETDELEITLKTPTIEIEKETYKEDGITVKFGTKDITSIVTPTYKINETTYKTVKELEDAVNTLSKTETEIKITYTVTYKKKTKTATRTVKVKSENLPE